MSISSMKVIHFENLKVTDISELNPSIFTRKTRTKSRVKVKKGTKGDLIDRKDL